jgi:hypothetical protein
MAYQQHVQPMGTFKNLLIRISSLEFLIITRVPRMEGLNNEYSMLLGRPWLQQFKVHHDWNTNLLSLSISGKTIIVPIDLFFLVKPCHQPLALPMYD